MIYYKKASRVLLYGTLLKYSEVISYRAHFVSQR